MQKLSNIDKQYCADCRHDFSIHVVEDDVEHLMGFDGRVVFRCKRCGLSKMFYVSNGLPIESNIYSEKLIAGKYLLGRYPIDRNGIATTYTSESDGEKYYVKAFEKDYMPLILSDSFRDMSKESFIEQYNYPGIPRVVEIIEDEDSFFIVREYIEGKTLEETIEESGKIQPEKAVEIVLIISGALKHLYSLKPVCIYRGVTLRNILITKTGEIVLNNFTNAIRHEDNELIYPVYGLVHYDEYRAPETFNSIACVSGTWDIRTDIYSIGITLKSMLMGNTDRLRNEIMFDRDSSFLNSGLKYIVNRCCETHPNARYQNCDELIDDLKNYKSLKVLFKRLFNRKK